MGDAGAVRAYRFACTTITHIFTYVKMVWSKIKILKFNMRLRVKILVDELIPVNSIEKIFSGAAWWESEIWDMYGFFFRPT